MRVLIVSNLVAGKGLTRDAEIFAAVVRDVGHEARLSHFDESIETIPEHDLLIACEVIDHAQRHRAKLRPGGQTWYMVNPEWHLPGKNRCLDTVDRVLCRTEHAASCNDWGGKAVVTGFESVSPGEPGFASSSPIEVLLATGGSIARGTAAAVDAWEDARPRLRGARLIVLDPGPILDRERLVAAQAAADIDVIMNRLNDEDFRALQRRCAVHVIPSEHEGWGHMLWEGLAVGAHVVTTDGAWLGKARDVVYPVAWDAGERRCLVDRHMVRREALASAMVHAVALANTGPRNDTRVLWRETRDRFRARFSKMLAEVSS